MSLIPSNMQNMERGTLLRTLLLTAAAVIIVGGMKAIASMLSAFLLAVLISTVCIPLENWLERKGMSKMLAFIVTLLISVAVGIGTVIFIGLSIFQVINQLPKYQAELQTEMDKVVGLINSLGFDTGEIAETAARNSEELISISINVLRSVAGALSTILLMYLFLFYILMEGSSVAERLHQAVGKANPSFVKLSQFVSNARRYLILRTIIGAAISSTQTVLMLIVGVDFALLWGFLSFICNYIPNIGFIIAIVPPAVMLYLEQGLPPTIIFVIIYTIINNFIENFIAPKFIGVQVNLSPLTISACLIFWTWVLGPLGALLALPVTLFVKGVLLEGSTSTRVLAVLMSESAKDFEAPLVPADDDKPKPETA
jgi:predicted PurR-regulated permease PerM